MNLEQLQRSITLFLSLCTFITVLYSALKIVNRNTREWELKDIQMHSAEERAHASGLAIASLQTEVKALIAVSAQIRDIKTEVDYIRARLDRFLDTAVQK